MTLFSIKVLRFSTSAKRLFHAPDLNLTSFSFIPNDNPHVWLHFIVGGLKSKHILPFHTFLPQYTSKLNITMMDLFSMTPHKTLWVYNEGLPLLGHLQVRMKEFQEWMVIFRSLVSLQETWKEKECFMRDMKWNN